jgi:hypothetical protein
VSEVFGAAFISKKHGDVVIRKTGGFEVVDDARSLLFVAGEAEDGGLATIAFVAFLAGRLCAARFVFGHRGSAGPLDFYILFADLFGDRLAFCRRFFADANFFPNATFFLNDGFFAAERNEDVFLLKIFAGGLSALRLFIAGNALDDNFLALQFDGLIDGFGADDLTEANAAGFHLALADFDLFLVQFDFGAFLAAARSLFSLWSLRLTGRARLRGEVIIRANLAFGSRVDLCCRVVTRSVFDFFDEIREADGF